MAVYKAVIEMPQGDTHRRHFAYDKTGFVDLGPLIDKIPLNDGIMPVHYGFIPDTENTEEGDDVDILLIRDEPTEVGGKYPIRPIAMFDRADGDHKVVAVDPADKRNWNDIPDDYKNTLLEYFGYNAPITTVSDASKAIEYIENSRSKA